MHKCVCMDAQGKRACAVRRATALQLAASGKRAALVLFLIAERADATKTNKKGCAGPLSRSSPARLQLCRGGQ